MGSSSSKVAGKAAAAAGRRQYPSTSSILNNASSTSNAPSTTTTNPPHAYRSSTVRPDPSTAPPSDQRSPHVDLDARDPDFGAMLGRLGPAKSVAEAKPGMGAFPTSSRPPLGQQGDNIFPNSEPANNPALTIVRAREEVGRQWEVEKESLGRGSFVGRTLLSAKDIREVIRLRDEGGMKVVEIERQLRLKGGIMGRIGGREVVGNA